jgi:hypothetical protein
MAKKKTDLPQTYKYYDALEVAAYLKTKGWTKQEVDDWLDYLAPQCNGAICAGNDDFVIKHPEYHEEEEIARAKKLIEAGLPANFEVVYSW